MLRVEELKSPSWLCTWVPCLYTYQRIHILQPSCTWTPPPHHHSRNPENYATKPPECTIKAPKYIFFQCASPQSLGCWGTQKKAPTLKYSPQKAAMNNSLSRSSLNRLLHWTEAEEISFILAPKQEDFWSPSGRFTQHINPSGRFTQHINPMEEDSTESKVSCSIATSGLLQSCKYQNSTPTPPENKNSSCRVGGRVVSEK